MEDGWSLSLGLRLQCSTSSWTEMKLRQRLTPTPFAKCLVEPKPIDSYETTGVRQFLLYIFVELLMRNALLTLSFCGDVIILVRHLGDGGNHTRTRRIGGCQFAATAGRRFHV